MREKVNDGRYNIRMPAAWVERFEVECRKLGLTGSAWMREQIAKLLGEKPKPRE